MDYVVTQLGARMAYAVPRILHAAGRLDHFFTDISAGKGWLSWCGRIPPALQPGELRRLTGRVVAGLPRERVTSFNLFGLRYAHLNRQARSPSEATRAFLWAGRTFCRRVLRAGLGEARGVYVFNSAGLEVLQAARAAGRRTTLEQTIAPRRIENRLIQTEVEKFPVWQAPAGDDSALAAYCDREEAEWQLADVIVCGSRFVRDGIAARGGPAERCVIVPYGVDGLAHLPPRGKHSGPLRVLVAGTVGLRKGSPYVLAAARALGNKAVFRMVGKIDVLPKAAALLSEDVELTGSVPRSDMAAHFAWADVFLLPSLCEGSATVVYEALAASLPVVCTANTGSVVRDGIEGFIVPACDGAAIVEVLARLAEDAELRRSMAEQARRRADSFDLAAYGRRLLDALDGAGTERRP
jgi:glycosyltransferase involved in cell wall biosynthesis